MMVTAGERDPTQRLSDGGDVEQKSMWYVPTYYGQTFHPVRAIIPPNTFDPPDVFANHYL